jgi:glycosyltransferase involved in cell wall biosynthesis
VSAARDPDAPALLMVSGDVAVARGEQSVFWQTLRLLSPHWSRIDVLCPSTPGARPQALHGNVFVHPGSRRRLLQPLFVVRHGALLARERRYGLIVSHDYGAFANGLASWLLAHRLRTPFVSEIHHVEGYPCAATTKERVQRQLAGIYVRWVWRRAAAIRVVNAVELPQFLAERGVPAEKVLVRRSTYLDLERFRPLPNVSKRYDALLVGRLVPNKGLDLFLDAAERLARDRPDFRACILGDGPLLAHVEERRAAASVDLVRHLDDQAEVARAYNAARVLVCASTAEGGPRVTVEAMACGVPVVSTRVGLMPEIVRDGESGFLVDWDADEIAARVATLLDDPALRARVAEAGRRAVGSLAAERVVAELAEAYRTLAAT